MNFLEFSNYLEKLSGTSSRIEITKTLADLYSHLSVEETKPATYLLSGILVPSYEGVVFNIAESLMVQSLAMSLNKEVSEVKHLYQKLGDLGLVAQELSPKTSPNSLSINQGYEKLLAIANLSGVGSQLGKVEALSSLLSSLEAISAKYLVRILMGNLRLGFSDKTILDALSWMESGDKSAKKKLEAAYQVLPDVGHLAMQVKKLGIKVATKNITPVVGVPVMPMLAQRIKSPTEMIKKMGTVAIEPKFDGLRVLIHYSKTKGVLKAFTRNLHDISHMFPELGEIGKSLKAHEIILDSEAVGMDEEQLKMADFQTTMQRRRKHSISDMQTKIPLTFQVFDILYKDGKSYMDTPYIERREALEATIINGKLLKVDDFAVTDDATVITKMHHTAREEGLEGIIVKKADSTYVPGRTGWRWVKMKESEEATGKLSDTVDGIIMGFSVGRGKRASFGIGQFLVGVVDGDKIKTVTKVGTGLTDAQFQELNARLLLTKVAQMPLNYEVHKNLSPDFWVTPSIVVELAADDLTVSPNHTAGYALRFPRLVKFRDDKSPKEATTLKEIKVLYDLQKK